MAYRLYESRYKDQTAITLESDRIRAQFLPGIGAKLASLVYRPHNVELMLQRPGDRYLLQPFDGDYVAGECSGCDDMFPTIDACWYDRYPWQGVRMADHGEVWSLPWECRIEAQRLLLSVHGVRFPYRLEKVVGFAADGVLRIEYRLTNLSPFDLDFVWAAHMMVNLEDGAELSLPDGVQSVVTTFDPSGRFGGYGDEHAWPVAHLRDGSSRDLRRMRPRTTGEAYKYYVKERMPEGWCTLRFIRSDFTLHLEFSVATVPFLGILPNEGGWRDEHTVFLEPCTAPFDRPDAARYRGHASTVRANSTSRWHLLIGLQDGV